MAENPIVTDAAWSCTITSGSAIVALIGILGPATGAAAGDFVLDAAGVPLALEAVGDATFTLARPAAAASAGTVQLKWMKGPHRSLAALSTQKTVDVYTRQQIAIDDSRSQPVIAWQNDPPGTPAHGDRYLVKVGTGAWAGKDGAYAKYNTSGTPGWLFTTPVAGWTAHIIGSFARLHYSGSAWGTAAAVSSATTAGRLARFTDTAGGLGQSQMSEDGSGNVSVAASISAGGEVQARDGANYARLLRATGYVRLASNARDLLALDDTAGTGHLINVGGSWKNIAYDGMSSLQIGALSVSGTVTAAGLIGATGAAGVNGYATLKHGDATATGYLEFQHKDGTRRGYIGYAAGGSINMVAEGGYTWNVSGQVLINDVIESRVSGGGTFKLGRADGNAWVIENVSDGASLKIGYRSYGGAKDSWSVGPVLTFGIDGNATFGGDVITSRSVPAGLIENLIQNTGSGVGATARLRIASATANGHIVYQVTHNSGSPYALEQAGSALTAKYMDFPQHIWRSQAGVQWAYLGASGMALSVPLGLKTYTLGTLPSAAANSGATVRVSDGASNKQIVTSDGSVWRYSDGVSV